MTNSYRKTPIHPRASMSNSWYKRVFNKKRRTKIRELLAHGNYDLLQLYDPKYDWWSSPKDGKFYYGNNKEVYEKYNRK